MQTEISSIKEEIFRATPKHLIAEVIARNHSDVRITNTLVESYLELSLSRIFTLDEVVIEIRAMNPYSNDVDNKISFVLEDSSIVAISEETFNKIKLHINNDDTIRFMRINKENFCNVIDIALGE